ncbi:MAG: hypothetical protein KGM16_16360 [Bacteroidota bacterium]|nr:hypothetical protein [Bacteroidota bacterium]
MKSYFILFLLLLTISCSKEDNTPPNTSSNQIFPHNVGNHWVYKYNDGYTHGDQYIYVDIVGTGTLPDGQEATIWTTTLQDAASNKYLIDSSFVVIDDKKAVFYAAPCRTCIPQMFDEKRRYIFPLQVGNKWFTDKFFGDTTKVLNKNSLTVPAGTFNNTFQLSKIVGYAVESYTQDSIWLTPNIGMTKFYQNQFNTAPAPGNGTWELANYSLK